MQEKISLRLSILFILNIIGIITLYTKYSQLQSLGGFYMLAKAITGIPSPDYFSILQKASIFSNDILTSFIILPITLFSISLLIQNLKLFKKIILIFSVFYILILYVNIQSLTIIGTYLNINLLIDSIKFGIANTNQIINYVSTTSIIKLVIVLLITIAIIYISNNKKIEKILSRLTIISFMLSVFAYLWIVTSSPVNISFLKSPVLLNIVEHIYNKESVKISENPYEIYRKLLGAEPYIKPAHKYFGTELNSDLILFVMETAPVSSIDFTQEADNLPGISKLVNHSLISSNHYTTYPYTRKALFSILTSMYPINIKNKYINRYKHIKPFGLMEILKNRQYNTDVYNPLKNYTFAEVPMMKLLGASKIYLAPEEPYKEKICKIKVDKIIDSHNNINVDENRKKILFYDIMAFEKLKDTILEYKKNNKKFCALFLPQLSHGPWLSTNTTPPNATHVLHIGHELISIQLEWLNELIVALDKNNWLKNTIILVTTDHGLRTKQEFPNLPLGQINKYSFNVPFLLYAPNTFNKKIINQHLTSHIDIMPTLLTLLGIEYNNEKVQGSNMIIKTNRKIFFIARNYFGADGYYDTPFFYSYNYMFDLVLKSKDNNFDSILIIDNINKQKIIHNIQLLYALTNGWR